jgi:hypothetical protein
MQMELDLAEIRDICDLYQTPDIFNMDETALNYKASLDSSLSSEVVPGGKLKKERKTICFCCNADGTQKMDPWFIGTASANKKAWMTGQLLREYLRWFNLQMTGRKGVVTSRWLFISPRWGRSP